MTEAERDIFARLKASKDASGQRSALFRWFVIHHDDFAALLRSPARPGWEAIAGELNREGLTMRNKEPVTADYARRTWWKAARAHNAHIATPSPAPAHDNLSFPPVPSASPDEDDNPYGFKPAGGLKDWTKKSD